MKKFLTVICVAALSGCGDGGMTGTGGGAGGAAGGGTGGGGPADGGSGGGATADAGPTNTSGFATATHGFSFENYTNAGVTNLTHVEVRRFFGDRVCASMAGGCTLTPAAESWMEQANAMMAGGHCFGFSHLALSLFKGTVSAQTLGAASASGMDKANVDVQREIAFWMATQLTDPARTGIKAANRTTPQQMLRDLATLWGRNELATLAFFKRAGGGGHAVTPHSIRTLMDGKQELVVYDNNFPGMDRVITFDPSDDSWSYTASINPTAPAGQYDGDATTKSIMMVPVADAVAAQQCPFCEDYTANGAMSAPRTVGTTAGADLMIEDMQGHSIGTVGNALTDNFPGASANRPLSADLFDDGTEPQYSLPPGTPLRISLDGANLPAGQVSDVSVVGPGYSLSLEGVSLDVGQREVLVVSADGDTVDYTTTQTESADVVNGFSTSGADYVIAAKVVSDADGAQFILERTGTVVAVRFSGAGTTQYGLVISRIDTGGAQSFLHTGESLAGDTTLTFDVSSWAGQGQGLSVDVDEGSNGSVERTELLTDLN